MDRKWFGKKKSAGMWVTKRCWIETEYDGIWEFVCLYLEMIILTVVALYLWSHVIFSAIQVSRKFFENSNIYRCQAW